MIGICGRPRVVDDSMREGWRVAAFLFATQVALEFWDSALPEDPLIEFFAFHLRLKIFALPTVGSMGSSVTAHPYNVSLLLIASGWPVLGHPLPVASGRCSRPRGLAAIMDSSANRAKRCFPRKFLRD